MSALTITLLVLSLVGSALVAGVFFAFSNFIMGALARVPASGGLQAMQSINVVVLNGGFLGLFMGTAVAFAALAVIAVLDWHAARSALIIGAALAYIVGTFIVTIAGNVPLNERLADLDPDAPDANEFWRTYLERWTRLNSLRTLAAAVASSLLVAVLLV